MNNLTPLIERSREIYRQALDECDENVKTWKEREKEYFELRQHLDEYPKKLSHEVMVPLGRMALMPGRLVHTNEIMVLLGDNWFVGRSAHQAKEIVDRRLKYITDMIKKVDEERASYVDRLEETEKLLTENDGSDCVEIHEPIKEEPEKQKRVRIAHQPKKPSASASKKISDQEHSNIMSRLDELHQEERFGDRFPKDLNGSASSSTQQPVDRSVTIDRPRKVVWKDEPVEAKEPPSNLTETAQPEALSTTDSDGKPSKSILRNRDELTPIGELPPSPYEMHPKVIETVTKEVFSGKVLERPDADPSRVVAPTTTRRVSKFAQERAKKH